MNVKVTAAMAADAKKSGGRVKSTKRPEKPSVPDKVDNTPPAPSKVDNTAELQALRDEISKLRTEVAEIRSASDKRVQELSAMVTAMSTEKPVRVKPVRDLDPKSKTYLLVKHYDFVPVSYRKLDS